MKNISVITNTFLVSGILAIGSCTTQDEKAAKPAAPAAAAPAAKAEAKAPAAEKAPAKAKAEKAAGDIGLLDTEKNYLILVTKPGKLVSADFDDKTKVTKFTPAPSKVADISLGTSATVTYTSQNGKNVATAIEYKAKKGRD
jgi:nucleoid-associated protein YgaU